MWFLFDFEDASRRAGSGEYDLDTHPLAVWVCRPEVDGAHDGGVVGLEGGVDSRAQGGVCQCYECVHQDTGGSREGAMKRGSQEVGLHSDEDWC